MFADLEKAKSGQSCAGVNLRNCEKIFRGGGRKPREGGSGGEKNRTLHDYKAGARGFYRRSDTAHLDMARGISAHEQRRNEAISCIGRRR